MGQHDRDAPRLAHLLLLADGRLPTGGHATSGGVEWAAPIDDLADPEVLGGWILARVAGPGTTEAAFAVAAAAALDDPEPTRRLAALDTELVARTPSPRARTVSRQLGRQFLASARRVWPDPGHEQHDHPDGPLQPLALGVTAGILGLGPVETAAVAFHHQIAGAITAAVRLVGADPIRAARIEADLAPAVAELTADAVGWASTEPAGLPGHGPVLADILTEHHGTHPMRMFVA